MNFISADKFLIKSFLKARLIWLEYDGTGGAGEPSETLFLIGKGVTIDTGGTDLKVGGAMLGMSRDKYGSAVVAGRRWGNGCLMK